VAIAVVEDTAAEAHPADAVGMIPRSAGDTVDGVDSELADEEVSSVWITDLAVLLCQALSSTLTRTRHFVST
jgi:uncharacterized Zn finger protein